MLTRLLIENLLLIERAELDLCDGLNVLTGETGAGKTMLADALNLLLGGKPRQGIVRPGAREAYVEGSFLIDGEMLGELPEGSVLEEIDLASQEASGEQDGGAPDHREGDGGALERDAANGEGGDGGEVEVVLARRVGAGGRSRAYLNGRAASVADLRQIGGALINFYGQHEHRRLMLASTQLGVLDAFCGEPQQQLLKRCAAAIAQLREAEREIQHLAELEGAKHRELDLLQHEIEEIERLDPKPGEHAALIAERERLRALDALRAAVAHSIAALSGDEQESRGAAQLSARAAASVKAVAGIDADLDRIAKRLESLEIEAQDIAEELRRSACGLDAEEGELDALEDRLAKLERLMRKHGGDVEAVLAHRLEAVARRSALLDAERSLKEAEARRTAAGERLGSVVQQLRANRLQAAERLEVAVCEELSALAMPDARFEVRLTEREPTGSGGDAVELMLAPNPGVPIAPLREAASGGELSRTMLALMSVASSEAHRSSLVFDEVDAGIGGQTARAVGERLRALAGSRQVICITHLPQIASLADRHFTVSKDASCEPTRATVEEVGGEALVRELVRMLGAESDSTAARLHAQQMLKVA